jgi:hypothetical protein
MRAALSIRSSVTAWPEKKAGLELHCAGPPSRVVQRSGLEPPAGASPFQCRVPPEVSLGDWTARRPGGIRFRPQQACSSWRTVRRRRPSVQFFFAVRSFTPWTCEASNRDHHIPRASTTCRPQLNGTIVPLAPSEGTRQGQTRAKVGDAKPTGLPRAQRDALAKPAGLPNGPATEGCPHAALD